jgi:hypothetical protein
MTEGRHYKKFPFLQTDDWWFVHNSPLTLRAQYICVVGGVVSGLGKGITISSIGVIMKACGLRVS